MQQLAISTQNKVPLAVSIVMPCLNEIVCLPHCIANARDALQQIEQEYGLAGEIVVADNGSSDGSQALAHQLGARVVAVANKGYGAALRGGIDGALGSFLIMGDCDGSYDFTDSVPMIGRLIDGADLCMGSRLRGGIAAGAMPWKNRYIGNPALTGILNLFFRSGIGDAHCGLRAIRKDSYCTLGLSGAGMEFASEMIIKASLRKMRIDEVPASLSRDLRDRPPHLRPWRDGWRHLRYLFMLSPTWAFAVPAFAMLLLGAMILGLVGLRNLGLLNAIPFGDSWTVIGGLMLSTGHLALIMALVAELVGARAGYRAPKRWLFTIRHLLSLESFLLSGFALVIGSIVVLAGAFLFWSAHDYRSLPTIFPIVLAGLAGTVGIQTLLGGVLLAVISGHQADFLDGLAKPPRRTHSPSMFANFLDDAPSRSPRYVAVAGLCLAFNNLMLLMLDHRGLHYAWCVATSVAVMIPVSYLLHTRYTFEQGGTRATFVRFAATQLINLPIALLLFYALSGKLGLPMIFAAPLATGIMFAWNFASAWWAMQFSSKVKRRTATIAFGQ